jgi:hypothetical protein
MTNAAKPAATEHAPYYSRYIDLVAGNDVVAALTQQAEDALVLLRGLDETQGDFRYAPEKWSIKELIGHINDAERIFAYRVLCFARGDTTPLPGFEQDDYIAGGNFAARTLDDLIGEYEAVRSATLALLRSFDDTAWQRRGTASDNEMTARAAAYVIAGHELHHVKILRERYLG